MNLPKRKPTRLKGYDYSKNGAYFVTVCTYNRQCILSNIVGEGLCALPQHTLTQIGKEIEKSIHYINDNYIGVTIDKYVIMPNHIHLIVILDDSGGHGDPSGGHGDPSGGHGDPPLLQNVIGRLKSYTANKFMDNLWQRSFHDHIIRNEKDFLKIWKYIDENPLKWEEDCFYS